jgi:hypothetical protein
MGALATIIEALSNDVVSALAAASYPPLAPRADGTAGAILVGTAANFEQAAPPRIIFEPVGSKFKAADYASASAALDTTERRNQKALRTIAAEDISFDVRCWGAAGTGYPVDDYDVTRALYHQVRASLQKLLPGAFAIEESGAFTKSTNVAVDGREFVFGVTFFTPIMGALVPYGLPNRTAAQIATVVEHGYAPPDVVAVGTDRMVLPDGSGTTEPGCD